MNRWAIFMASLTGQQLRKLAIPRVFPRRVYHRETLFMKAAFLETTGPSEVIRYGDLPDPVPKANEILIRVGAAALNPIDLYIRAGLVAMPLPKPFISGCDVAGTVAAVGPGVKHFKVGDRVWGSNQG